jgi:hypothetical protein
MKNITQDTKYDEVAALETIVREIHQDWKGLKDLSTSGQKAWLTQMKNHYTRIIRADAEAAAEMLATREYHADLIRKHGQPK